MKKIILIATLFSVLRVGAQDNPNISLETLNSETNEKVLKKHIKTLEKGTAEDLFLLTQYYSRDEANKAQVEGKLLKKYPNSFQATMVRVTSFMDKENPDDTEAHFKSLAKDFPHANLDMEKNLVAMMYSEVPDTSKVMVYINAMEDPIYRVAALVSNLELLEPVGFNQALDIASKEIDSVEAIKNLTISDSHLKVDPKNVYYQYINQYGKLLFKAGKDQEAYKYTKEAYQNMETKDQELIQNYAYLSSMMDNNYEEALPVLAKMVEEGKNESRYLEQVRKAYQNLNPNKDVDAYVASLQEGFIAEIQDKVKELMINEPAPNFYVTDVNGKKVTLEDFKGKTIVIDFWATWCIPCVASFPAMKMAVNRYANDPDVEFLFIHTWDNVAEPLTNAKDFLSKRNYDFDLYMDFADKETKRSPAANVFKINGIPAKFVIDAKGRIRFNVSGFEGKDEIAAEELSQMIELAKQGV